MLQQVNVLHMDYSASLQTTIKTVATAAILVCEVGVGEAALTFRVESPTQGGHSSWKFQLQTQIFWLPASNT